MFVLPGSERFLPFSEFLFPSLPPFFTLGQRPDPQGGCQEPPGRSEAAAAEPAGFPPARHIEEGCASYFFWVGYL